MSKAGFHPGRLYFEIGLKKVLKNLKIAEFSQKTEIQRD